MWTSASIPAIRCGRPVTARCLHNASRMTDLVRLGHGLHRPAETVADLTDRVAAFLDVLPPETVVGGITAARLHGFWLPKAQPGEKLEFVINRDPRRPHQLAHSRRDEIATRRRAITRDEVTVTNRFSILSPARTWVDLCENFCLADAVAAGDSVLHQNLASIDDLNEAVRSAFRRRGVLKARTALPLLNARSRSRGESHLRVILVVGGLPYPEVNVPINTDWGEWLAEPDLVYRRARLVLEYNGSDHAGLRRMRKDISRELDIDINDWKIVVFGPSEVFGHPHRIVPYVRCLLDRRDPEWRRRPH